MVLLVVVLIELPLVVPWLPVGPDVALDHLSHPERRVAPFSTGPQSFSQLGLRFGPLPFARRVGVVRLVVVLRLKRGRFRVVMEHHLLLLMALLSGVVVVLKRNEVVHPKRSPHLLKAMKIVPNYVTIRRLKFFAVLRFTVWTVRVIVRFLIVRPWPIRHLQSLPV